MVNICPELPAEARYSVAEAAIILGISSNTVRNRIKSNHIKTGQRRETKRIFIKGSEIIRFWKSER